MENPEIAPILNILTGATFLVLLLFFAALSVVLNYHWKHYGITEKNIERTRLWYFGFSLALFSMMALLLVIIFT